jgi:hypothetical protein
MIKICDLFDIGTRIYNGERHIKDFLITEIDIGTKFVYQGTSNSSYVRKSRPDYGGLISNHINAKRVTPKNRLFYLDNGFFISLMIFPDNFTC